MGGIRALELAPDGKTLAFDRVGRRLVSGGFDHTLRIWHPDCGKLLLTLDGHQRWVSSVEFSPEGMRIVSSGADHTIKVWDPTER